MDMFVIEMLVVLIHSLKMAHRDEKALGELNIYSARMHIYTDTYNLHVSFAIVCIYVCMYLCVARHSRAVQGGYRSHDPNHKSEILSS